MKINCGFSRKIKGSKFAREHKNITDIEIKGLTWEDEQNLIREILIKHKPKGSGWWITGYALISA